MSRQVDIQIQTGRDSVLKAPPLGVSRDKVELILNEHIVYILYCQEYAIVICLTRFMGVIKNNTKGA